MTVSSTRPQQKALIAIFFSAFLAGCSFAKLAYNNFDWLLLRKVDAYLDLSPEQTTATRERLRRRLEEHRRDELPAYLDYLRRTRVMLSDGLSSDEAQWIVRQGRTLAETTVERTVPAIAETLADLSPAQIDHLEGHFAEVNGEFRRKFLPSSLRKRSMRRVRRTTSRIEHWTGALDQEQRQRVEQLRGDYPETSEDWLSYNAAQQRRLLVRLRDGADSKTLSDFLTGWWVRLEGRGPELERKTDEALMALTRLIVGVDDSLDSAQRRFLLWRLDSYIEQIEALIAGR